MNSFSKQQKKGLYFTIQHSFTPHTLVLFLKHFKFECVTTLMQLVLQINASDKVLNMCTFLYLRTMI